LAIVLFKALFLKAKIAMFIDKQKDGVYFNDTLRNTPAFRNPCMLEKVVALYAIDQYGSNFAKEIYDPHRFEPRDYLDAIAKEQLHSESMKSVERRNSFETSARA
jgi:hypothetical protein